MWQYVEERGTRAPREREFRPASVLVTLNLPRATAVALDRYNVDYVNMTAGMFATDVLALLKDQASAGLRRLAHSHRDSSVPLQRLDLIRDDWQDDAREFLLGREPRWSDIGDGFAIERDFDNSLVGSVDGSIRLLVVTGTAGSGKSTSAMRLTLELAATGRSVAVVGSHAPLRIRGIRDSVRAEAPDVLFIDDAGRFGDGLPALILDLRADAPECLIVCALRSSRYRATGLALLVEEHSEWTVEAVAPPLADRDVDALLDALSRANRLGDLTGKPPTRRRAILSRNAGASFSSR